MTNERAKECPKCEVTFSCYITNCWCADLPNIMPMIEGTECYCPTCLREIINELGSVSEFTKRT